MNIKKSGGKIFGAQLTSAEKKALDMEIKRQIAEYDRKHKLELQALVLWELHEQLGFGVKRLKEFYNKFDISIDKLLGHYQLEEDDKVWLCTYKLKEIGLDIEKLNEGR